MSSPPVCACCAPPGAPRPTSRHPPSLLPGLTGAEKLTLDTSALAVTNPDILRLSLCLLLVAAAGLPRGGLIRLAGAGSSLSIEIEGPRAAWPEALAACLAGDPALFAAADNPRTMAVALACLHVRALGTTITLASPTRLAVTP